MMRNMRPQKEKQIKSQKKLRKKKRRIAIVKEEAEEARKEELKRIIKMANRAEIQESNSAMQKAWKEVVKEFFIAVRTAKKCPLCQAANFNIKKDGYTKLFRIPLSEKEKHAMQTLGIEHENITYNELKKESSSEGEEEPVKEHNQEGSEESGAEEPAAGAEQAKQVYMHPLEVREHLRKLWSQEQDLMDLLYGKVASNSEVTDEAEMKGKKYLHYRIVSNERDMFFIDTMVVPPNRFRPESRGDGDEALLHRHTVMLTRILNLNLALKNMFIGTDTTKDQGTNKTPEEIKKIMEIKTSAKDIHKKILNSSEIVKKWIELQDAVNVFLDSSKAMRIATAQEFQGIRQLLERKEGLFRMKMMGKRVNFAARSVISPDPYIDNNEIGIPQFMAKKLTFPESVAEYNAHKLRKLVTNGPDVYPGANVVEDERGVKTQLSALTKEQRKGIAKILTAGRKIVYRHMQTGDILLLNRQPTLHRPSIMGHKARILPKEQTIRMHYSNCASYNADFDGDEMNAHLVQNQLARAEGYNIMSTNYQYIVPTSGRPLRGLIQDYVVSGVYLTARSTMFTKAVFQELIYISLHNVLASKFVKEIVKVPPAIIKPVQLWTGKQVVTVILKSLLTANEIRTSQKGKIGLNLTSKSKLPASVWGPCGTEEGTVIVLDSELLCGILDKAQFGATEFGLVHAYHELYGPKV